MAPPGSNQGYDDNNQFWNWDDATGAWVPDPVTNPNGAHAPQGAQAPPPPGKTPGPPAPAGPDPTGGVAPGSWEAEGLVGGTGHSWWIAGVLDRMQANPEQYGMTAEQFQTQLPQIIQQWNAMPPEVQQHMSTQDGSSMEGINAGINSIPAPPQVDQPPPPPGNEPPRSGPTDYGNIARPGDPNAPQTWEAGEGIDAFRAAKEAWRNGGMNGPAPKMGDFGGVYENGKITWGSTTTPGGTEPGVTDNEKGGGDGGSGGMMTGGAGGGVRGVWTPVGQQGQTQPAAAGGPAPSVPMQPAPDTKPGFTNDKRVKPPAPNTPSVNPPTIRPPATNNPSKPRPTKPGPSIGPAMPTAPGGKNQAPGFKQPLKRKKIATYGG